MKRFRLKRYNFKIRNKMSKENETSDKQQNGNDFIADVMPRFSESEIEQMAYEWSSERSVGDAEQDSQCMYDYAQGMKAMQRLLLNGA